MTIAQWQECVHLCSISAAWSNNILSGVWPLTSQCLCLCSGIWALWTRRPARWWEKHMIWSIPWWSTSRSPLGITGQKTRWDKKRWSWIEAGSSLIFTVCIILSVCVCIFIGGGKCNVCLEEPLLPDLQWDASICYVALRRTNQSSRLKEGWCHWLFYPSEQESQKCTCKYYLFIYYSLQNCMDQVSMVTLSCVFLPMAEHKPGSLHFHWSCPDSKGTRVAVAPSDSRGVQHRAAAVWDQLHHPRGSGWGYAEHHSWRHESE